MRFALVALALLPSAAFGAISILGPSSTSFWVQNSSNVITWTSAAGDPSSVDVLVVNSDNTTLNGPFSIAQFVDISSQTVTITNVTLKVGSNYQVEFVNPQNHSQIYATSNTFDVKTPGTAPAPTSSVGNNSASATGSAASSSGTSSANGTSSSDGTTKAPPAPSPTGNSAGRAYGSASVFGAVVACGVASLAILL